MTTLTFVISMYSCPSIFSTLQIYTVYIYISYIMVSSLSLQVPAARGNEGLEAGHVDAVADAARDLHRS